MSVPGVLTGPFWAETARGVVRPLAELLPPRDPADWAFLGTAGLTVAAMAGDEGVRTFSRAHRTRASDAVATVGNAAGNGGYALPAVGALALAGWGTGNERLERASVRALENALVGAGVYDSAIKYLAHRHRPRTGDPPSAWDGPGLSGDNDRLSFPSGHASLAFALAAAYADEYGWPWGAPIAWGLAGVTAFARVDVNAHWTSDVLFGAALGAFTGHALAPGRGRPALTLAPAAGGEVVAATAAF